MTLEERYQGILSTFKAEDPDPSTELEYTNPYELLVAVILSAQCTDDRINQVTPALFQSYPSAMALSQAEPEEVFPYIKSVSYPNNKSKHLVGMARMLINEFNGEIPSEVYDLQRLPGVGRKTANVIASVVYRQPAMAVDTHVFRVSKRLGLVPKKAKTPLEVEKKLIKHIPTGDIAFAHHWLILHGRYICMARKPQCGKCSLTAYCRYYQENFR